jgi:hypothetical protein
MQGGGTYEVVCEDVEGEERVDDEVQRRLVGEDLADFGGGDLRWRSRGRCISGFLPVEERLAFGVVSMLLGQSQGFSNEPCEFGSRAQTEIWLVFFTFECFLCE